MRDNAVDNVLEVHNVSKSFGGVLALNDVSLTVPTASLLGIIGPNGSGKTTLVNVITGFVRPDAGRVRFRGRDITGRPPHEIAARGIARTFQTVRPFRHLRARENLIVPLSSPRARRAADRGRWGHRDTVAMDLLEEVGFERDSAVPNRPAGALPHGYLRRLELARCLALSADVIITDELFSGLSHAEIASMLPLIEKLNVAGVTVILVEHRVRELFRVTRRVVVMDGGRVVIEGSPDQIASDDRVRELYLGAEV